jgi:hypothetical protein
MASNNSYNFFCALYNKYHPGRKPMELKDCINNVTHSLLQEGEDIRQRSYGAPPSVTKDLTSSTSTERINPLHHQQLVMGLEDPVLFKRLWVYIIKKFVLTGGRGTTFQEFINQCPV